VTNGPALLLVSARRRDFQKAVRKVVVAALRVAAPLARFSAGSLLAYP
jgi:hypothetical protein